MAADTFGSVLAISPHLDDAVLSAASLLAAHPGSAVATVFAGAPARYGPLGKWDADCGFVEGDDVVAARRIEDRKAVEAIGATPRWLDFVEIQYQPERPTLDEIADALRKQALALDVEAIAFPLGLYHPDHVRTHDACMTLLERDPGLVKTWLLWADIPYRVRHPDLLAARLESLRTAGYRLDESIVDVAEAKPAAVACYASQLRALGAHSIDDAEVPEQIFTLTGPRAA